MKITDDDVFQLTNLIKALERAEYPKLNGLQIIAFTRMFEWLDLFSKEAFKEHEGAKALATMKIVEPKTPIVDTDSKLSKVTKRSKPKIAKKKK